MLTIRRELLEQVLRAEEVSQKDFDGVGASVRGHQGHLRPRGHGIEAAAILDVFRQYRDWAESAHKG